MAEYLAKEGFKTFKSIMYYFKHRKELKNEKTLARVLLTRGTGESLCSNIFEAIDFITPIEGIASGIDIQRGNEYIYSAAPITIMQDGDRIDYDMCMFHEYYRYNGKELVYECTR